MYVVIKVCKTVSYRMGSIEKVQLLQRKMNPTYFLCFRKYPTMKKRKPLNENCIQLFSTLLFGKNGCNSIHYAEESGSNFLLCKMYLWRTLQYLCVFFCKHTEMH